MDKDKKFEAYHRGYDQGGKPLMEEGKPRTITTTVFGLISRGRLQQRTDATDAVCVDTAYGDGNDGKQLSYCPMCGRPLGGNEDG